MACRSIIGGCFVVFSILQYICAKLCHIASLYWFADKKVDDLLCSYQFSLCLYRITSMLILERFLSILLLPLPLSLSEYRPTV